MAGSTLHRDAMEASLAEMRGQFLAAPPPASAAERHAGVLTLVLTGVVMGQLASVNDEGDDMEAFAQGLTHAVANVVGHVASYLTQDTQPGKRKTARILGQAILTRAIMRGSEGGSQVPPVKPPEEP